MTHIVVIGAGVAGLGAAYKLKRAADQGLDITYTVIEKSDRVGGQLWTERAIDVDSGQQYVADGGSDSFLTEKPAVHRVARLLGIDAAITGTNDDNKRTFIVKHGKLVEMPDGIMMFAPTKIVPMATTSLYSWPAKFRMALDVVMPPKKQPDNKLVDESVESLVVRRLGRECLDRLAEAIVGGVNGSDPKTMSVLATYPMLLSMEQEHGSLIKGFMAQRKKVEAMKKKYPPKPGTKRRTFFSSFTNGLGSFTDALADAVGRDKILTGRSADSVKHNDSSTYEVHLSDGTLITCDGVICACEAWVTSQLIGELSPSASKVLDTIPHSSCATIILGYDKHDVTIDERWHGVLTPAIEERKVTGISLISSKWEGRTPDGKLLLRGFVGGPRDPEIVNHSDEELIELVRENYAELLGVPMSAQPTFQQVFRFPRSMPQYTVGHLDRMAELTGYVQDITGVALAGAAYTGVGVPNCLESGEKAVSKVLRDFGISLAEDTEPEKRVW